ncbi:MAG TPA: dihydropteroate synthase, partial [Candidatus Polarisedimenticolia bacterium]|nr:dihydropteroate synthase [Candidatus Polarisedimenticolia bacterium]
MTHPFLLLEDFRPPSRATPLRALGLPDNLPTSVIGLLLRIEGLSSGEAKGLILAARRARGRSLELPPSVSGACVVLILPAESRDDFLRNLRADAKLLPLSREVDAARKAARGELRGIRLASRELSLSRKILVQGILNVTPDSFYDGGKWLDPVRAREHAWRLKEQGADLIDVGGESTRPGSRPVPVQEEIRRVVPAI